MNQIWRRYTHSEFWIMRTLWIVGAFALLAAVILQGA